MSFNSQQFKFNICRTILRLTPLMLMGLLTLVTFWLVRKNTPTEHSGLERVRLHEPDYIIQQGTLSALNEQGNTNVPICSSAIFRLHLWN